MAKDVTVFSAMKNAVRNKYTGNYVASAPGSGWWNFGIHEPFAGAWQSNIEYKRDTVLAYHAIFACITLIASDISKLRVKLIEQRGGIWYDAKNLGKYAVLDNPNGYQNRMQFFESWINSKMIRGNTYVLLKRNISQDVVAMYVLNPDLVLPMVTPDGEVFYQLGVDNLSGIQEKSVKVPARDIIHDRFNCLCHPLVGLSPIFASGLAAFNGLKIQTNSAKYFENMSRPSGILTTPGSIKPEAAAALKAAWESNYVGENYGRVAVLGDDLKYNALSLTAEESQMVEQLRLTAEIVCSTFHVPKYKVIGDPPSYNNIEALEQGYYSQCLQSLIESIELVLDEGLMIPDNRGVEFDLDGLLRMDTKTQVDTLVAGVKGFITAPNEARKKLNLPPLDGGDTIWLQEQNWPMDILADREPPDAAAAGVTPPDGNDPEDDPADGNDPVDGETPPGDGENDDPAADQEAAAIEWLTAFGDALKKEMEQVHYDA